MCSCTRACTTGASPSTCAIEGELQAVGIDHGEPRRCLLTSTTLSGPMKAAVSSSTPGRSRTGCRPAPRAGARGGRAGGVLVDRTTRLVRPRPNAGARPFACGSPIRSPPAIMCSLGMPAPALVRRPGTRVRVARADDSATGVPPDGGKASWLPPVMKMPGLLDALLMRLRSLRVAAGVKVEHVDVTSRRKSVRPAAAGAH